MLGWTVTVVFGVIFGAVVGLAENWARGEAIPAWRILILAIVASLVGCVASKLMVGRLIMWVPIICLVVVLLIDRANDRIGRHL